MEPFLRSSEHWKGLIQRREINLSMLFVGRDVTSSHVGRALLFFVSHFFSFMHFILVCTKLCLEDDDLLLLRRNEAEFNQMQSMLMYIR
jgi:hypothetical protein